MDKGSIIIRKARVGDIPAIHQLINEYASQGEMLPRSRSELYEGIRDLFVAEEEGLVLGCGALHINWDDLAEVRSLAVMPEARKRGIGKGLVGACLREAAELGIARIYALTYRPGFFQQLGFSPVSKDLLPQKVWADCLKCPQFPNCDEEAVLLEMEK